MNRKAVLITGSARRVGAALVRAFATAGYDVALHYHHSKTEAVLLAEKTGARLYQGDLANAHYPATLLQQVVEDLPHLAVLINNASTFPRRHLVETTPQTLADDIAINLLAPLNLMREFAARAPQANAIINILDANIKSDHPAHFAYLVAKKGLAGATQMAARELAPQIRVNGICPGHLLPTEGAEQYDPAPTASHPLLAQLVQTALALAEDNRTGQLIEVC